jgi:hypothetical protein
VTGSPSFERFDYLLRANKHIERKLVFDSLQFASAIVPLNGHSYLGLGSMWFGDFRYAHKQLGINSLTSVERAEYRDRAEFNRPYGCIDVVAGDLVDVLRSFGNVQWAQPYVAWLDFDGRLDEGVVASITAFVEQCAADSILIVTINANRNFYRTNSATVPRDKTSVASVEHYLGATMVNARFQPRLRPGGEFEDLDTDLFAECLADSLLTFMEHKLVKSGRGAGANAVRFIRLFNIAHVDGAHMITVGGVIAHHKNEKLWEQTRDTAGLSTFLQLDLIPITIKEKLTLDSCLPHQPAGYVGRAQAAGIKISDAQIDRYCRHFRQFPVFVESVI